MSELPLRTPIAGVLLGIIFLFASTSVRADDDLDSSLCVQLDAQVNEASSDYLKKSMSGSCANAALHARAKANDESGSTRLQDRLWEATYTTLAARAEKLIDGADAERVLLNDALRTVEAVQSKHPTAQMASDAARLRAAIETGLRSL